MFLVMCADMKLLIGLLFVYLLAAAVCLAPFVFIFVLIVKWAAKWQEWPTTESLPEARPGSTLGL